MKKLICILMLGASALGFSQAVPSGTTTTTTDGREIELVGDILTIPQDPVIDLGLLRGLDVIGQQRNQGVFWFGVGGVTPIPPVGSTLRLNGRHFKVTLSRRDGDNNGVIVNRQWDGDPIDYNLEPRVYQLTDVRYKLATGTTSTTIGF